MNVGILHQHMHLWVLYTHLNYILGHSGYWVFQGRKDNRCHWKTSECDGWKMRGRRPLSRWASDKGLLLFPSVVANGVDKRIY